MIEHNECKNMNMIDRIANYILWFKKLIWLRTRMRAPKQTRFFLINIDCVFAWFSLENDK